MKLIHPNATFLLRPKTGLNDMVVEVEPGSGKKHIEDGANFSLAQTEPNTNLDAFLGTLDTDTRQYLQLLVAGGAAGHRRPRHAVLQRPAPLPALRPLHGEAEQGRRPAPRRAGQGDPRLRPADHRTGPPRRRDQALRHLLRRRPRQLRQPAAVDPGRAAGVPGDADGDERRPGQLHPLLAGRLPGADRPDPAGPGTHARPSRRPSASSARPRRRSATRSAPSPARSARC